MDFANLECLSDEIAADYLEQYGLIPLRVEADELLVGSWTDGPDEQVVDDLALHFRAPARVIAVAEMPARMAVQRLYSADSTAEDVIASLDGDVGAGQQGDAAMDDLISLANEAPVIKLVNLLLLEALEARASDVHLEGYGGGLRVRYRIDGVLQDAPAPPPHLRTAILSRLKIMADLDIAERRIPQDGRMRMRLRDRQVDVRVSTLPTLHAESIVLRLLDKDRGRIALGSIGMSPETQALFEAAIERPHGIVLATGPTGSGKTTTLYAAIDRIRTGREKILTVEDPVEYELAGVPQVAVNPKAGLTFATALRALLRQDPDVLLVGEIRDSETAEIATHAALTGHLVLSTLHTNDAATAITRLLDLGVEPYLVASTVEAVLAQRLVRCICDDCRIPDDAVVDARLHEADRESGFKAWRGRGCPTCRGTGYRRRTGLYELLAMDDEMRLAVHARSPAHEIARLAVTKGMETLRADGLRKVRTGVTTVEEVARATQT